MFENDKMKTQYFKTPEFPKTRARKGRTVISLIRHDCDYAVFGQSESPVGRSLNSLPENGLMSGEQLENIVKELGLNLEEMDGGVLCLHYSQKQIAGFALPIID